MTNFAIIGSCGLAADLGATLLNDGVAKSVLFIDEDRSAAEKASNSVNKSTCKFSVIKSSADLKQEFQQNDIQQIVINTDYKSGKSPTLLSPTEDHQSLQKRTNEAMKIHYEKPAEHIMVAAAFLKEKYASKRTDHRTSVNAQYGKDRNVISVIGSRLIRYGMGIGTKGSFIAAKNALCSLAKSLSRELTPKGITISIVNPDSKSSHQSIIDSIKLMYTVSPSCDLTSVDVVSVKNCKLGAYIPNKDLRGHVAVITGGSNGIGRGIALGLARQGCDLALIGRNAADLQEAAQECKSVSSTSITQTYQVDVTDFGLLKETIEKIAKYFGKITCLVCSAGVNRRRNAIERDTKTTANWKVASPEVWGDMVDVNLKSAMTVTQYCLPYLADCASDPTLRGGPTIIYVSSSITRIPWSPVGGQISYQTTKSAMTSFCNGIHRDVNQFGIKAVAFHPELVDTALGTRSQNGKKPASPEYLIQKSDMALAAEFAIKSDSNPISIDFLNVGDVSPKKEAPTKGKL